VHKVIFTARDQVLSCAERAAIVRTQSRYLLTFTVSLPPHPPQKTHHDEVASYKCILHKSSILAVPTKSSV